MGAARSEEDPPYDVVITRRGQRAYNALPREAQARFDAKIALLPQDPRPDGTRPLTGHPGALRLRAGDYRMIFQVDDHLRQVTIHYFGHRSDVYKRYGGF